MEWTTTEGDSHQDALKALLKTLGADRSELEIEDLGEHRKMLGLGKTVYRMRGRLKRESFQVAPKQEKPSAPPVKANEPARAEKVQERESAATATAPAPASDSPAGYLSAILADMGIHNATVETDERPGQVTLTITSDRGGLIIGHKGETLDALQTILEIYVNRQAEARLDVTVDTENYRSRREDMLLSMADKSAREAIETGRKVRLGPMRSSDRKLIHTSLQDNPKVQTKSEGEGNNRQVVIFPS